MQSDKPFEDYLKGILSPKQYDYRCENSNCRNKPILESVMSVYKYLPPILNLHVHICETENVYLKKPIPLYLNFYVNNLLILYELCGIITYKSHHYVAYIKPKNNSHHWYRCNDTRFVENGKLFCK